MNQVSTKQNFSAGGGSENKPANESDDASDDDVVDQVLNLLEKFKDSVVNWAQGDGGVRGPLTTKVKTTGMNGAGSATARAMTGPLIGLQVVANADTAQLSTAVLINEAFQNCMSVGNCEITTDSYTVRRFIQTNDFKGAEKFFNERMGKP